MTEDDEILRDLYDAAVYMRLSPEIIDKVVMPSARFLLIRARKELDPETFQDYVRHRQKRSEVS